jgi:hypothetical protein
LHAKTIISLFGGGTVLDSFMARYQGKTTGQGHEIRIDKNPDGSIMLWYLFWGDGADEYHHMGLARVRADDNRYAVDLYQGNSQSPVETRQCSDLDAALIIVDTELARK